MMKSRQGSIEPRTVRPHLSDGRCAVADVRTQSSLMKKDSFRFESHSKPSLKGRLNGRWRPVERGRELKLRMG